MGSGGHGGAELFFARLAVALQKAGQEQAALIRREAACASALAAGGVAFETLPFGGLFDFATSRGFRRAVARHRPDIVLTWMSRATNACPRRVDGVDFVHVGRLGGYYDPKYYRHCDYLIANTQDIAAYLRRKGWPEDRVRHLPNFVTEPDAAPVSRAALATPSDAPLALALGRLHPNKAFDVLLAAAAQVPRLYLWLAGEGGLRRELEHQAARLAIADRVRFLGWRDDADALLAAADFLVCPSRHEPLGNVVIEAWAARRPVIAAASSGPMQLIADRANGLLVPVDDADTLAKAMREFLADEKLRRRLAEAGRAEYEAEFSETRVVAQYREFFRQVTR